MATRQEKLHAFVKAKTNELIEMFQSAGYEAASVAIDARAAPFSDIRRIEVNESYDWTPSEAPWEASEC